MNSQGLYRFALDSLNDVIDKGLGDPDVYSFRGTVLTLRGEYDHAIHDFEEGFASDRLNGRDGESYAFVRFVQGDCTATDALQTLRHFGSMHKAASIRLLSTEVEMHRYCQESSYGTSQAIGDGFSVSTGRQDTLGCRLIWRLMKEISYSLASFVQLSDSLSLCGSQGYLGAYSTC